MKGTDKFLIGVVVGVLALVCVASAVVLLRPKPTYLGEDTPEGVAHNYLFALHQKEYARAYSYLSPALTGYPKSLEAFAENIRRDAYSFPIDDDSITLEVQPGRGIAITSETVEVPVRETRFFGGGLFSSESSSTFTMDLKRENGAWRIISSDSYFVTCWTARDGCR